MTIPDYQTLMLPVLKTLGDDISHNNDDIVSKLAEEFKLTDEECKTIYGGNNTKIVFNDRIAWARTYLKKAGLIYYPERSLNKITKEGLKVLKANPVKINEKYLTQFQSFREFRNIEKDLNITTNESCEIDQTPDDMIQNARNIFAAHLESDLLEKILANSPTFFEKLVAKLLFKMGYGGSEKDILQNCGKSGDGGIDGVINQDVLGLDQVHIQAKRYKNDNIVQVGALRDFCGALYGKKNPKGVFITTSSFTKPAMDFAKDNDLILIDGNRLTKLMIEYNIGVQIKDIIEIKKIDIDFFDED